MWVENPNTLLRSSWSEHTFQNHRHSLPISSNRTNGNEHHSTCSTPTTRLSRLVFDGQLSTVRDVIEENSENADEPNMMISTNNTDNTQKVKTDLLVDLDIPNENYTPRGNFKSSHTISDFATQVFTPCIENRELPHSISHSSGYHSFTEEENGSDSHREFAGCLNVAATKKLSLKCRDLELKTFLPGEQSQNQNSNSNEILLPPPPRSKERARSLDRTSQRKLVRSYPSGGSITPTILMSTSIVEDSFMSKAEPKRVSRTDTLSPVRRNKLSESTERHWSRSPAKPSKLEQHQWQLCMYMFGGREQGAPGIYRQPISIWKLYV